MCCLEERPPANSFTDFKNMFIKTPVNIKDTHREKASSNKTPALRKSTNIGVWAVGKLNQLFKKVSKK